MSEDNKTNIIAEEKSEKIGAGDAPHVEIKIPEGYPLSEKDKKNLELSKMNPKGGIWNVEFQKWEGYQPTPGVKPNWNPFDPEKRRNRVTLKERKFMAFVSRTGDLSEAYRAVYKVKDYGNPRLEASRVNSLANQVLKRISRKDPELVKAMTFQDIDKDFVKKGMLELYGKEDLADHDKIRLLELMGKTQAMFTDKVQSETKVTEVVKTVFKESDEDFPDGIDNRIDRLDLEKMGRA